MHQNFDFEFEVEFEWFTDDFEYYINEDSPDINHFIVDEDSDTEYRAVLVTTLDINGDPAHSAFNLASLNILIDSLTEARDNMMASVPHDDSGDID